MPFLAHPCNLNGWLICITFCLSVCLSGFVRPTLCTTLWVQDYIVHHQPALCTTDLHCAPPTLLLSTLTVMVHNTLLSVWMSQNYCNVSVYKPVQSAGLIKVQVLSRVMHVTCKSQGGLTANVKLHFSEPWEVALQVVSPVCVSHSADAQKAKSHNGQDGNIAHPLS